MTQPARMTLDVGTVRGIHGSQAQTVRCPPALQPCWPPKAAETGFPQPPTRLAALPRCRARGGGLGFLQLPRLPFPLCRPSACWQAWMVTQKHQIEFTAQPTPRAAGRLTLTGPVQPLCRTMGQPVPSPGGTQRHATRTSAHHSPREESIVARPWDRLVRSAPNREHAHTCSSARLLTPASTSAPLATSAGSLCFLSVQVVCGPRPRYVHRPSM